jgi:hypothetical protein
MYCDKQVIQDYQCKASRWLLLVAKIRSGIDRSYACGDTNTGEVVRNTSRHVSLKQEKEEARSGGSFSLEAYTFLARR